MGIKTRANYPVKVCMKKEYRDCVNRYIRCASCDFIQGKPTKYKKEIKK